MRENEQQLLRQKVEMCVREILPCFQGLLEEDVSVAVEIVLRGFQQPFIHHGDRIFRLRLENGRKLIDLTFRPAPGKQWASMHMDTASTDIPRSPRETRILFLAAFTILQMQANTAHEPVLYEDATGYISLGEILTSILQGLDPQARIIKHPRGTSKKTGQSLTTYELTAWIRPRT